MVFSLYGHGGYLELQIMTHFSLIFYIYHINTKYEISLKLAQYFHRKCHLKFFMNGCNFHKNFIYVIRTLSLIFLWKISFLAQRVHVPESLRHFSQLYPTHSRLVYDPTRTILAIYMARCPICFLHNINLIHQVVLGKKSFEWFFPYMGMAAIFNFKSWPILA